MPTSSDRYALGTRSHAPRRTPRRYHVGRWLAAVLGLLALRMRRRR